MSAATSLKHLHRQALRGNRDVSLKNFARELIKDGSDEDKAIARQWFLNKGPTQRRQDKKDRWARKGGRIELERNATHAAKRKKSQGGKGK